VATPLPNVVDYTSKDFAGFQQSLFAYAALTMPQWTAREAGDFGVLMTDMVSYVGDILSYYQDRIANEAFLATASQRASIVNLAALIGYVPSPAIAATGTVTLVSDPAVGSSTLLPAGTALITGYQSAIDGVVTFELDSDTTVPPAGGSVTANVTEGADQGTYTLSVAIGVPASTNFSVVDLDVSSGVAGQSFTLPTSPLLPDTLTLIVQLPAGPSVWNRIDSLLQAGPTDQVYALGTDANGASLIEFGDGVNGAIPPSGVVISASYKIGGGAYGNLASGSITDLAHAVPGVTVASSSTTTGGADPESLASVRINAPRAWRTQQRAVTLQDYADAALSVPAVSKASALMSGPGAVTIYILAAQRAAPTSALITAAQNAVAPRAMAGMSVNIQSGSVVGVNIGSPSAPVQLVVQPTYSRAVTLGAVTQALQTLFSADNTDFGMLMPLSAVYAAIDAVPGVSLVNVPVYARADLPQSGTFDAFFRAWECPAAGTFTLNATGGI
jgi:uncharacterized phage protein gp47/JayE